MNRLIVAHEMRTLTRSPVLFWLLVLLVAALLFAGWTGSRAVQRQALGAAAAQEFERACASTCTPPWLPTRAT
ncbi:MAG: hypothetical protein HC872_08760 [Gammaproteobacteria bacterium]|nr:hypothetical protein [Gammaproteobacteria bacterium]